MSTTSPPFISLSRRLRKTPYHDRVLESGVKAFSVYNHMLIPTVFESLEDDFWHLREHVQVWDVAVERQVEIVGPDALALVQLMTPRNIQRCQIGQCMYAPTVGTRGQMINDPVVLRLAEDRYWISVADSDVVLWADGIAVGRGLDVQVFEPDVSPLAIQGPASFDLMAKAFGEWIRDVRFFRFREVEFNGTTLVIARSGWSKQGGFEIYLQDSRQGHALWDHVFAAGKNLNVRAGCPNLIERIEGGLLSYGNEMTVDNNPLECGLDAFCDLPEGVEVLCRDALERIRATGVERKMTGVVISGDPILIPDDSYVVQADGKFLGLVTSTIWSPRLKQNVGMAMLENDAFDTDNLKLAEPNSTRSVEITGLPFE